MQFFDHAQVGPTFVDIYFDPPPPFEHSVVLGLVFREKQHTFAALESVLGFLFR